MIKKTIAEKIIVKTSEIKFPEIGEIMLTNQDEKVIESYLGRGSKLRGN